MAERHAILRMTYRWEDLDTPAQFIADKIDIPLTEHDWQHLSAEDQQSQLNTFKEKDRLTDFDLSQHEKYSGKKLQYFDPEENQSYVPYVLETSIGLDRMFLAVFSNSLQEEELDNGTTRTVLKLPAVLAPTKAAVLPLVKKDGLPDIAKQIVDDLKWDFNVAYDEKDAVGRRYRRQDANGTPFCLTVDHDTLEDNTVTIRYRDTMEQQRVKIEDLRNIIKQEVDVRTWLMRM